MIILKRLSERFAKYYNTVVQKSYKEIFVFLFISDYAAGPGTAVQSNEKLMDMTVKIKI